ncbi:MAG: flagellin domain protein [Proteobacteria bacterium]|nr:flagellin domain protein [Pseudomonadota bacterium]
MAQVINTNVASLTAQRNLNKSQNTLNTSLQRLSSGLRINSAKDDAAGLAISERMTSQIRGLDQAQRNANDGISLAQTAEGALGTIGDNLQRMRELSVQAANATNSSSDRASLQAEMTQLSDEITRVAGQTQFNGLNLLDGSFANQSFQVGANANQTISINQIANAKSTALGAQMLSTTGTAMGVSTAAGATTAANGVLVEAALTLTTAQGGTTAAFGYAAGADAKAIASAINTNASSIGIQATATNSTTMSGLAADGNLSFTLNGAAISATGVTTGDYSNLLSAINASTGTTGVVATFTTAGQTNALTLTAADGRDIAVTDFLNSAGTGGTISFDGTRTLGGATGTDSSTKTGTVTLSSSKGTISTAGANADVFASAGVNTSTLSSVAAINISTANGAQSAISVIDSALAAINSSRGDLGAIQNRFSSTISNLQTSSENLSASRSRIQDTDFAAETSNLTKAQILQQAGTAMLAQAKALPQQVLSLLQ